MRIVLGSISARKIQTVERVAAQLFPEESVAVEGYGAHSGVPDTPWDKQTYDGALRRARDSRTHVPGARYYIGLESGLIERYGHIYEEAWCAALTDDENEFFGYSSGLKVPDYVLKKMDELKLDHSSVMGVLEGEHGRLPNDTWGSYSGGMIVREISLEEAVRNALIQMVAPPHSFYRQNHIL
jgi:non-canonical (house-cleaning) NTP pyrophosphatase